MTTAYKHRAIIAVRAGLRDQANDWAASLDPDDGSKTYGVPLSEDGSEPATWYACNTKLTDSGRAGALSLTGGLTEGTDYFFYFVTDATGEFEDGWTWEGALADAGLQTIDQEAP